MNKNLTNASNRKENGRSLTDLRRTLNQETKALVRDLTYWFLHWVHHPYEHAIAAFLTLIISNQNFS
ncbi:hypothetical protein LZD49_02820 [Dyadobacter sp. CY261]|uniref:hypothetical protein n=1 Tax=Dyadobacter sp. CY261 TaxID=2907203 RepID=UPI001F357CB8|nr:hypothetical protein [Dyadobacter sp. CY261]MCF0069385.1 hypothetical protein [Dyadobacter sp. CY261]